MAISSASYARGNPIYNGGSNAPTRGTVDPMGYIDRGLDNPSQSRSGLAQAALTRLQSPGGTSQFSAGPFKSFSPIGGSSPLSHQVTPTGQLVPGNPITSPGSPVGGVIPGGGIANNPNDTSSPYDAAEAAGEQRLLANRNAFLHNNNLQRQNLEERYVTQQRDVQNQHPNDLRSILNGFAGRGLAQSSGYGYQVGQNNDKFAQTLAGLDQNHTSGINALTTGQNDYEANYAANLQGLRAAAVARLAGQAGDLGLGGDVPTDGLLDPTLDMPQDPTADVTPPVAPSVGGARAAGTRALSTFDKASQARLKSGNVVVGGDGRVMKYNPATGQAVSQGMAGTRALNTFSAAAQAKLKAGGSVVGGDGRVMKYNKFTGKAVSQGMAPGRGRR